MARAAYRAARTALSRALQAGDWEVARRLWAQVPKPGERAPKRRQAAWRWLQAHLEDPRMVRGWRQVGMAEEEAMETLGPIESLVGAVVAQRMKGKRRHGSPRRTPPRAKVLQVVGNREVKRW